MADPTKARPQAQASTQVNNARCRVTEWRLPPGATTGWHRHDYAYVVVPLTTGRLLIKTATGESLAELVQGRAYDRPAGIEHEVINANDYEFVFIDIDLKGHRVAAD
ncbi:MAG: cupin [Alphaproteobacteria bacterium]|nr:cupin [Alphaproteobacteria bacterium]